MVVSNRHSICLDLAQQEGCNFSPWGSYVFQVCTLTCYPTCLSSTISISSGIYSAQCYSNSSTRLAAPYVRPLAHRIHFAHANPRCNLSGRHLLASCTRAHLACRTHRLFYKRTELRLYYKEINDRPRYLGTTGSAMRRHHMSKMRTEVRRWERARCARWVKQSI
jgi:hypothetical protein